MQPLWKPYRPQCGSKTSLARPAGGLEPTESCISQGLPAFWSPPPSILAGSSLQIAEHAAGASEAQSSPGACPEAPSAAYRQDEVPACKVTSSS